MGNAGVHGREQEAASFLGERRRVTHHPIAGPLREVKPAPHFSHTPVTVGAPAPALGEHTDEVLAAFGLDPAALRAAGALG